MNGNCPICGSPITPGTESCNYCQSADTRSTSLRLLSFLWKRRSGIAAVGVLVGILAIFPYLRPGPLTSISQRIIADIEKDEEAGASIVSDNMKPDGSDVAVKTADEAAAVFLKLRSAELATQASHQDLKVRIEQLKQAWAAKKSQRAIPVDCQVAMQDMIDRFGVLAEADGEKLDMLQTFKPESATHEEMASVLRRHAELDWQAVHAIDPTAVSPLVSDQWRNNAETSQAARQLVAKTEKVCEGYWN